MTTNVQGISDAEYAAALAAGRIEAETEIRAQAVRYVPERDAIEIVTSRNAGFLIPRQWIGALQDVPTDELSKLEVWRTDRRLNSRTETFRLVCLGS